MPAAPQRFQAGTGTSAISFSGIPFPIAMHSSVPPKVATGYDIARDSRMDTFPLRHDDWSGGFLATSGIYSLRDRNRVFYNEGLVAVRPGQLHLPFVTTVQANNDEDTDCSADRAANRRIHAIMSSLGANGLRFLAFRDLRMYRDTSLTDPASSGAVTSFTDKVLSVANLKMNSVDYTAISTDGTTDDTKGTTDVTGSPPTWTSLVTHANAADGFYAMDYFATLGGSGWNVFYGVLNNVNGWWACKSTATVPQTSSTMLPIIYKDSLEQRGTSTTIAGSVLSPYDIGQSGQGSGGVATPVVIEVWESLSNALTNNASNAAFFVGSNVTDSAVGLTSDLLFYYDNSAMPKGAELVGLTWILDAERDTDIDNVHIAEVQLVANGSNIGNVKAGGSLTTTDADYTFGSSTDNWGVPQTIRGRDLQNIGVRVNFAFALGPTAGEETQPIGADYASLQAYWRSFGTQASLPKGGWSPGKPPHEKDLLAIIHPVSDEETTIFKPRIVTKCKFTYDGEGDQILVEYTQPAIQMASVDDADWYQGGLAILGGTPGAFAQSVKLIDNNNVVRDLGFPPANGTNPLRPYTVFARGAALMCWAGLTNTSGTVTNAQLMYYFDGKWGAYGALLGKSTTVSTAGLVPWAERTLNTQTNYIYAINPDAQGDVEFVRQFVPVDIINHDPWLQNTAVVKQDGPLYIQGVEIESLPSEANNAILSLYMQSRQVDNNTSYGSVNVKIDTGGDNTITSAEIDQTFDAAAETFTERNIVSSGDPGVAFKTTITRVTLNHEASSTETPNGCTVQINMTSDWDPKREFGVLLVDRRPKDVSNWFVAPQTYPNPYALCDKIDAQVETKVSQAFLDVGTGAVFKRPVKHKPYRLAWRQDMAPGTWEAVEFMALNFLETAGGLS